MRRKIMLILALLMLVSGTVACGKQTDSSLVNESETEQIISQTEESEGFDMERIRNSVIIKGQPFEIPIALSDLGEGWTWKEHENSWVGSEGNGLVYVYYNDEEWFVGTVRNYYEGNEMEGIIYNLGIESEDSSIDGLVPLVSTKQEVIERYGEPNEISEKSGNYHYGTTNYDSTPLGPLNEQELSIAFDEKDTVIKIIITYADLSKEK